MQKIKLLILLLTVVAGSTILFSTSYGLKSRAVTAKEALRPADVQATVIAVKDCGDCFDPYKIIDIVDEQSIVNLTDVKEIDYSSGEAKVLIEQFGITKVPAIIFEGEILKENARGLFEGGMEVLGEIAYMETPAPIYIDLASGEIVGRIEMTILDDAACEVCYDPQIHEQILKNRFEVTLASQKVVDIKSAEGRALLRQYKINLVPTIILTGDVKAYEGLTSVWQRFASEEDDGSFVFRDLRALPNPVYKDLTTGEIIDMTNKE